MISIMLGSSQDLNMRQKQRFHPFTKLIIMLFLLWFVFLIRKRHWFLHPRFRLTTMFSSNEITFIISFILRRWVIKINSRFYSTSSSGWESTLTSLSLSLSLSGCSLPDCVSATEIETLLGFSDGFFYNRFTRSMQSSSILFLFLRWTRYFLINSLRILLNSFRMTFRI